MTREIKFMEGYSYAQTLHEDFGAVDDTLILIFSDGDKHFLRGANAYKKMAGL
jgi:hypothetical protein